MLAVPSAAPTGDNEALHEQLEDSLEDLADGLDVLMILEKAYEKTIRAHVVPQTGASANAAASRPQDGATPSLADPRAPLADPAPASLPPHTSNPPSGSGSHSSQTRQAHTAENAPHVPLMEGSSTALLAILEHPSLPSPKASKPRSLFSPHPRPADVPHAPSAGAGREYRADPGGW